MKFNYKNEIKRINSILDKLKYKKREYKRRLTEETKMKDMKIKRLEDDIEYFTEKVKNLIKN